MKFSGAIGKVLALLAQLVGEAGSTLYAVGTDDTSRATLYKVDEVTGESNIVSYIHENTNDGTTYYSGRRRFHSLAYDSYRGHLVGLVSHPYCGRISCTFGISELVFIDERTGRVFKTYQRSSDYSGTLAIDKSGRIYIVKTDIGGVWYILNVDTTNGVTSIIGDRYRPPICCPRVWVGVSLGFDDNDVLHQYSLRGVSYSFFDHHIVDTVNGVLIPQQSQGNEYRPPHFLTGSGDLRPRSQLMYAPGISGGFQNMIQIVDMEKTVIPWFISTRIPRIDALAFDQYSGARLEDNCAYGPNIPLEIDSVVPYYGDITKLLENGLIPEVAVLRIAAYDIEYNPTRPYPSNGMRFHVYFNDDEVGVLTGDPGKWKMNRFSIPLEVINFPDDPGKDGTLEPEMNRVRIEVTGAGLVQCIQVDKVELTIDEAPRPVLLVHGYRAGASMWIGRTWANHLTSLGIPFDGHISLGGYDSIANNAHDLKLVIADAKRRWGVDKLNIVAHSKGGLDSRHYVENHDDIAQLIQIATPNEGTTLVELAIGSSLELGLILEKVLKPEEDVNLFDVALATFSILGFFQEFVLGGTGPAFYQLATTHMKVYNLLHGYNPNVRYTVLAGSVIADFFEFPTNFILNLLIGAGDGVVPVTSAFALDYTSDEILYSGATVDAAHGGLDGLPQSGYVLNKLIGYIEDTRYEHKPLSRRLRRADPPNRQLIAASNNVGCFTVAGVVAQGEVFKFPLTLDTASDAHVLFTYTSGQISFNLTHSQVPNIAFEQFKYEGNKTVIYWLSDVKNESLVASVSGDVVDQASVEYVVMVLLSGSSITLEVSLEKDSVAVGTPLTYFGTLTQDGETPLTGANVSAVVATPEEELEVISLLDDGVSPDEVADDGIYTGQFFDTNVPGNYRTSIRADGDVPVSFSRSKYVLGIVTAGSLILDDNFSDEGADDNSDGYYDRLVVKVSVDAIAAGVHRIFGELTDSAANKQTTGFDAELQSGINSVDVTFDGREIFQNQVDGPYYLTALRLAEERDLSVAILAEMRETYKTAAYSFRDFQHKPIHLWTSMVETHGIDTDDDDLYNDLRVEISIHIEQEGEYHWSATLQDTNGTEIDNYISDLTSLKSGTNPITFEFNGTLIAENGLDGPFTVAELILDGGGFYSVVIPGSAFETGLMKAEDFDPCPNDSRNVCIEPSGPTVATTKWPSTSPSSLPSMSLEPSSVPSEEPSVSCKPSSSPSISPSISFQPPSAPSTEPSMSSKPSIGPSLMPSLSSEPSEQSSNTPSVSSQPSAPPSIAPSASSQPSASPSSAPLQPRVIAFDIKSCRAFTSWRNRRRWRCNKVILKARGCLLAVILGSSDLDVSDIDTSTIRVCKDGQDETCIIPRRFRIRDVGAPSDPRSGNPLVATFARNQLGRDGIDDLTFKLRMEDVMTILSEVEHKSVFKMIVRAYLRNGDPVVGEDAIQIKRRGGKQNNVFIAFQRAQQP